MKKFIFSAIAVLASAMSMSAISTDNLYVVGSGCEAGWSPNKALEMTKVSDNVFTWTGQLNADGEFKFIVAREWHPSITCDFNTAEQGNTTVTNGETYDLFVRQNDSEGKDNKFQVATTGIYTLNVDLNSMKMAASLDEGGQVKLSLYMVGNATEGGWDLDNAMKQKFAELENGHYSWSGDLTVNPEDEGSGCFRIISQKDWWKNSYTTTDEEANQNVGVGEYDLRFCEDRPSKEVGFRIAESGSYIIDVDTENLKMTITAKPEALYIMGNALNGGASLWDLSWAQLCASTGNAHEFEWEGFLYAVSEEDTPTQFKFLCQDNDWNPGYVATQENLPIAIGQTFEIASSKGNNADWKFTVPEDGYYKLVINTEKLTMAVSSSSSVESVAAENVSINVNGLELTVAGAAANVFDITGRVIAAGVSETVLPAAGIYVVVVDGHAYKVAAK